MENNKEYNREKHRKVITRDRTEKEIHTLLGFGANGINTIDRELFNPNVLYGVVASEREGIGIYYSIYQDGSCAEAQHIKFSYGKQGNEEVVILERATDEDIREYDKERLTHLLRR